MSLCYSVRGLIGYILAENCIIWYTGRARMQKVPKFLLKSMFIFNYFNIALESTFYKLQNAHKNRISGNRWKYEMTGTYKLRVISDFLGVNRQRDFFRYFFGEGGVVFFYMGAFNMIRKKLQFEMTCLKKYLLPKDPRYQPYYYLAKFLF